ncbi:hypothetical protein ACS0TY_009966 [Phlomoides rotata]
MGLIAEGNEELIVEQLAELQAKEGKKGMQESKKETVDDILCRTLWGSNNMGWAYRESIGRSGGIISIWNAAFDDFIRNSSLIDLPLHVRSYTWYRPDGSCKSRLDRFLVNNACLTNWPNAYQKGLRRSLSDHCPVALEIKVRDWEPKPFRLLNAWKSWPSFREFVMEKWNSYDISGWGGFVLKEKLKLLKADLKTWNKESFGALDSRIERHRKAIQELDMKDESTGLEEQEVIRRNETRANLLLDIRRKDSLLLQKARCKWIKEGDANTSFFHKVINKRWKGNEITGEGALKNRFTRLYNLSLSKGSRVSEMGHWRDGAWRWEWRWRRALFDREKGILNELIIVLDRYPLKQGIEDSWKWSLEPSGTYNTKGTYLWLFQQKEGRGIEKDEFKLTWKCFAPPKVKVHAWRVLWERVPTSSKLQSKNILPSNMSCCSWLGIVTALPATPSSSLLVFSRLLEGRLSKKFLTCLWTCVVWLIWKQRNAVIFRNEQYSEERLIAELKGHLWSWTMAYVTRRRGVHFSDWNANPMHVLS